MNPVKLLLVDDDHRNLDVLESILDAPDYHLVRAGSADEALFALMTHDFAVIILDIRMPDMNGLDLAKLIKNRKKTQRLPIIFLTAYYQEDEHVLRGYGAGAVDYLSKPCNPAILRSKVDVFVDLYRKNQALELEISERRQAEQLVVERTEQLKISYEELARRTEQLARMASELTLAEQRERQRLAGLLHDHIQQLLVAASFKLHALSNGEKGMDPQVLDDLRGLINECMKASRSLTVELSPPILHEGGLTQGLQWLARGMEEKYELRVEVRAETEIQIEREDIRILLFQSVRELLFNVVKHAHCKEATVEIYQLASGDLLIKVSDEGAGFDPETLLAQSAGNSSGFGLFSIRERLMLLDGRLEIKSEPGAGSTFTLIAPASCMRTEGEDEVWSDPEPTVPVDRMSNPDDVQDGITVRLLLVDDHTTIRQGLAYLLKTNPDFRVIGEAADGVEAIEQARRLVPDVILMDSSMPRMDGLQATQIIHREMPAIKIIGLSMYDEVDRAEKMHEAGAVCYLTKNCDPDLLISVIRRYAGSVNKAAV